MNRLLFVTIVAAALLVCRNSPANRIEIIYCVSVKIEDGARLSATCEEMGLLQLVFRDQQHGETVLTETHQRKSAGLPMVAEISGAESHLVRGLFTVKKFRWSNL